MSRPPSTPGDILRRYGIESPQDIDIEAIAQDLGATILYEDLRGCEARIIGSGDTAFITVKKRTNRGRERFSAAHELGHWIHDRGRSAFSCTTEDLALARAKSPIETRANRFAQDLILPKPMIERLARGRPTTLSTVEELAGRFTTSLTATAIRLVQLGLSPAIVACYGKKGLVWHVRGPCVPDEKTFWLAEHPGINTAAGQLLAGTPVGIDRREHSADEWIEHSDAHDYVVVESSFMPTPDHVLALLWWEDESQITELENA